MLVPDFENFIIGGENELFLAIDSEEINNSGWKASIEAALYRKKVTVAQFVASCAIRSSITLKSVPK